MKKILNQLTLIGILTAGVMLSLNATAANETWTGGNSPDFNWNTNANWSTAIPVTDDQLFFAGTVGLFNTNNISANTELGGLTFNSGAGSFTLNGNSFTLANGGGITNNSALAQTNKLTFAVTNNNIINYVTTPGGGTLVFPNSFAWANASVANDTVIFNGAKVQDASTSGGNAFGIGGATTSASNTFVMRNTFVDGIGFARINTGNGIGNVVLMDNSVATNIDGLIVGNGSTSFNNQLIVSNGSKIYISGNDIYELGRNTGSQGHSIIITGPGSALLSGNHAFAIGGSSGNVTNCSVQVNNGALWNLGGSTFRLNFSGPQMSLSANNGTVSNVYSMIVGNGNYSNSIVIANGGKFNFSGSSGDFRELGRGNNAFDNTITITDPNSHWDNGGATLTIGGTSGGSPNFSNIVTVANSAVFTNGSLTVGGSGTAQFLVISNASAYINSLIVNGGNSVVYCEGGSGDTLWAGSLGNNVTGLLTNTAATTLNLVLGWNNGGQTGNPTPVIGGLVNITKTGTGTQNLNSPNTFVGNILVNGGTLGSGAQQAAADGTFSAFGNLVATGKTIIITNGGTLSLGSEFALLNGLTQSTLPPITVYAGSSVSASRFNALGQITLSGGTLTQNSSDASPFNGYQFYTNVTVTGSAASTISAGANGLPDDLYDATAGGTTFNVANTASGGADLTVSAGLADYSNGGSTIPGSLTKSGAGIMALSGTNTYSGLTTVANGKLILYSYSLQSGPLTVNDGKILDVTVSGTSQITNSTLTIGNSAGAVIEFVGLNNTMVAPVVASALTLNGPATINLVNPSIMAGNQYPLITYTTTGGSGRFVLGAKPRGSTMNLVTNNNGDGTFTLALNVTTLGSATTDIWSGAQNGNWDINVSTNWTISSSPNTYFDGDFAQFTDASSVTNVTLAAVVTPGSTTVSSAKNYTFISSSGSYLAGAGGLAKSGSGSLTLAGLANTYTGANSFTGGTVVIGADANLGNATNSVVLNNAALSSIATFTLVGVRPLFIGAATINVVTNQTLTYNSAVANAPSLSGSLTKTGPGTLSLGGANTYTGSTLVSGGKLIITTAQQIGGAFTVSDNAALTVAASGGATLPMSSLTLGTSGATTLTLQGVSGTNAAVTATNLTANGTVTLSVIGGATKLGEIPLIKYSTLTGTIGNFALASTLPPNVSAVLTNDTTGKFIGLVITSINGLTWQGANGGTWDIASTTNWLYGGINSVYSDGSAVLFDDTGAKNVTISQLVSPASTLVNNSSLNYTFTPATGSAGIGGPGGFTKLGAGTLNYASVTNSYAGVTVIGNGQISLAAHSAISDGSGGYIPATLLEFSTNSVVITNNAFLVLVGIGGSGTVYPQVMSNSITLNGGNIFATDGGQHLAGSVTIGSSGAALGDVQINKFLYLDGPVSGSGPISVPTPGGVNDGIHGSGGSGYGGPNFTASANPYSGTITLYNGYIGIMDANGTCLANAVLDLEGYNATFGAPVVWTANAVAGITLGGLQGANPAMILNLTEPSDGYAVSLTIGNNSASTFNYSGALADTSGTAGVTKTGSDSQWLLGTNTYTGPTLVNSGELGISTLHAGNGSFTVFDGASLGVTNAGSSLSAQISSLTLGSSGPTTVELKNVASTTIPVINCGGALMVNGTSTVKITGTNGLSAGSIYPLVKYGSFGGTFLLSLPAAVTATLTNDMSNSWIALKVTAVGSTVNTSPFAMTTSYSAGNLTLTWPLDHTGYRLQSQTNSLAVGLKTNWVDVTGANLTNQVVIPVNATSGSVFYRLIYP
jgi:fibronectin-binding autotransporter adhesin